MKKLLVFLLTLFSISGIFSQNCSKYYPLKEGVKFQITTYDKKDKPSAVINYEIKEFDGTKALMATEVFDDKDKLVLSSDYNISCIGNGISIDFKSLMSPDLFKQYSEMEIDMDGTDIQIPNNLETGQELPDANMDMTIKMGPINMNMSINMVNRVVEGKESVTTPAGNFNCIVISYETEMKMGATRTGTSKQWLAEGIGMVKHEDYNKNGKLVSSSLLTSYSE